MFRSTFLRPGMFPWCVLFLCVGLVPVGAPAFGQEAEPEPEGEVFRDVVEVNIVNVAVVVTDEDGRPVTGLGRGDFRVFEDGEPVEISNFYEAGEGTVVEATPAAGEAAAATASDDPTPSVVADVEPPTTWVAVVVDQNHIEGRNRKRVLASLRDHLGERADPDARYMLVSLGEDYRVVREFGPPGEELLAALDELERDVALGTATVQSQIQLLRNIERAQTAETAGMSGRLESTYSQLLLQIEIEAQRRERRGAWSLGALGYAVSSMAGLEGRKMLLYVGEGVPLRPGLDLFQALHNKFSAPAEVVDLAGFVPAETMAAEFDLRAEFDRFSAEARASGVSVWAIDAAGMRAGYYGGAARGLADMDSLNDSSFQPAWTPEIDRQLAVDLRQGLQRVVDETGGEMLFGHRNYGAFLERLGTAAGRYYSIGYRAPRAKDGAEHRVRVEVDRPGLRVRYQELYFDKTRLQRLMDATIARAIHKAGENSHGLHLELEEVLAEGGGRQARIRVDVPLERLALLPRGDFMAGEVYLVVVTCDGEGNVSPPEPIKLALKVPVDRAGEDVPDTATSRLTVPLPAGHDEVALGFMEDVGGGESTDLVRLPGATS